MNGAPAGISTGPVFICGASRSGTSLLAATIDLFDSIAVTGETHYFDDLRSQMKFQASSRLSPGALRDRVEDYFLALTHRPYGHTGDPTKGWMHREQLRAEAEARGASCDAYFEAFCILHARRAGKDAWGEKTPRHAFRIAEILELFPTARVLFMARDPRAVVASYRDWRNQGGFDLETDPGHADSLADEARRTRASYHPILASLLWLGAARSALRGRASFGDARVRIVRYEALCTEPERTVREIAEWLGTRPPQRTDSVPLRNSSYERFTAEGGFSTAPLQRWRETLSPREISTIERVTWSTLQDFGYKSVNDRRPSLLRCAPAYLTLIPSITRAARANMRRTGGGLLQYIARRLKALR